MHAWQEAMELFRAAFRGKHNKLADEIDVDHGLWIEMKSRNVLTARQVRDCQSHVSHCRLFRKKIISLNI